MSSLASGTEPRLAPHRRYTRTVTVPWVGASAWLTVSVAAVIALCAFVARGGVRLEPTTHVEIALMLGGAGLVAGAAFQRGRGGAGRLYGGWALLAFAALAAYTAVSIVWSLAPADSWLEANRTFAYLATFAGGLALARLLPGHWAGVLHGVALGAVIVCGWALLTKVFPASLAGDELYARLRAPFEYFNSVGLMAALGVPPLLWLAARRSGWAVANALAWPALGLLFVCVMLSYSRGSLLALAAGAALWVAVVPLRLRAVAALICSALLATPVVLWAFAQDGLTTDRAPMEARVDAGHELGALLLLMCVLLLAAGLFAGFLGAYRPPSERTRLLAGRGLLAGLALVPVVALIALAASPGGISGQASDAWDRVVDPQARTPGNTPDRLTETSSVRARYWDEALKVHGESPVIGTGAGAYSTVRLRFRDDGDIFVRHAHGYPVQTLADLGWIGLGLSLLAALAWGLSAARAVGMRRQRPRAALRRRARGAPDDGRRRGRLRRPFGGRLDLVRARQRRPGAAVRRLGRRAAAAARASDRRARAGSRAGRGTSPDGAARAPPRWAPPPERAGVAALAIVLALVAAWAAYQPVRSVHAGDAALERLDRGAFEAAASIARIAVDRNPLSVDPLFELAAIEQARGQRPAARRRAPGRGADPARQRRGVAPARPLPPHRAQPAARGAPGLPGRLLPGPAVADLLVGPDRGLARRARAGRLAGH